MAVDHASGLMDIASSLSQEEIPFKLRCAICNKLAVNAFRLPCCDQAVCENCQSSLPETCPVCAHTPISPDLCKPNKALRTTLKAFLRTEEKKREKDRQQATPAASVDPTPADAPANQETPGATDTQDGHGEERSEPVPASDSLPVQPSIEQPAEPIPENVADQQDAPEPPTQNEELQNGTSQTLEKRDTEPKDHDGTGEPALNQEELQEAASGNQIPRNAMGMNMGAGFGNMGWNPTAGFNPMSQFMANGMFNFQNPMGMPGMTMDPMTQGIFGGYGMNMNGMMGMGFDAGQGMYGGWDGSQNNMWNGGQDKFNPNAFANGMGQQYGGPSGFAGLNMSQPHQFPNQNYQNGVYGRGGFRGRGRGFYARGRGGFQPHINFSPNANPAFQNNQEMDVPSEGPTVPDGETKDGNPIPDGEQEGPETAGGTNVDEGHGEAQPTGFPSIDAPGAQSQPQGIPTIDSLEHGNPMGFAPTGPGGMGGHMGTGMGMGFGRGGYMRGGFAGGRGGFGHYMQGPNMPPGPGVEGAPAAPRAMRQGLPNTSVFRHRGYQPQVQSQGQGPGVKAAETSQTATPAPQDPARSISKSISRSRSRLRSRSRSRSRSGSHSRAESSRQHRRHRSRSYDTSEDDRERRRGRHRRSRREDKYDEQSADEADGRTRSPSIESSRRSSRRRHRDRDRRSRRSHRSRRHRTRSPSRNGDTRLSVVPEDEAEDAERAGRSHRSRKERSSRYDEERERERDRRRERDRDRDRYDRHHRRHREREKKRSRRERSESPTGTDEHARSRRVKRTHDEDTSRDDEEANEPQKDPHTLEREARNRERMVKEQQRRDAMHADADYRSSRGKRESRSERSSATLAGHRRVSYKYEDEESEDARADRVESEREAGRWA